MLRLPHGMPSVGTVVVADDDPGFRRVLKSMLAGIADRLIEAEDGAQALAIAAAASTSTWCLTDLQHARRGRERAARAAARRAARDRHHRPRRAAPPRAAALLHKDELTRERLAFAIRGAIGAAR